jgi:tetratricopeptide (TPR) repeat protein
MKQLIFLLLSFCLYTLGYSQTVKEYFDRGGTKFNLGDYRGAIADYNKAIELDPERASAYFGRGYAKYILGDINGACLDLSKAGELGHGDAYDMIKRYCK